MVLILPRMREHQKKVVENIKTNCIKYVFPKIALLNMQGLL